METNHESRIPNHAFIKMNGAGNDFVIFDARAQPVSFAPAQLRAIADRANAATKGCDQVIVIEPPTPALPPEGGGGKKADAFMRIFNADGSEVSACGNATRCVGWLLMEGSGFGVRGSGCRIETKAGVLHCEMAGERRVTVDMGPPRFGAAEIPVVAGAALDFGELTGGMGLSMGNPHVVFFVPDAESIDLARIGSQIEHRTDIFPERVNVSVAQVMGGDIILRVWERGAGLTQACGTAACATLAAAVRRGLLAERVADIQMPGGVLRVEWRADQHIWMTGPVEEEFRGEAAL